MLEFFISHFIEVARKFIQYKNFLQANFYIYHANALATVCSDNGSRDLSSFFDKIRDLKELYKREQKIYVPPPLPARSSRIPTINISSANSAEEIPHSIYETEENTRNIPATVEVHEQPKTINDLKFNRQNRPHNLKLNLDEIQSSPKTSPSFNNKEKELNKTKVTFKVDLNEEDNKEDIETTDSNENLVKNIEKEDEFIPKRNHVQFNTSDLNDDDKENSEKAESSKNLIDKEGENIPIKKSPKSKDSNRNHVKFNSPTINSSNVKEFQFNHVETVKKNKEENNIEVSSSLLLKTIKQSKPANENEKGAKKKVKKGVSFQIKETVSLENGHSDIHDSTDL